MSKLQRYSSYKESGVEWLGEIPKEWEVIKFKHLFYEKKKTHDTNLNCGSISFGKVVEKDDEKIPISTKASYQVLNKGEFLINPLNLNYDLKSLRIGLSALDVVVSSGYIIVKTKVNIDRNYFKWLLHIFDVFFMKTLGAGVRQTLNFKDIGESLLVNPSLSEQIAIASFLDGKTAKIDQAISQKEQLIELLKERRQIVINEAVTKGINPNVPMKESGVEWIGEIPEHYTIAKLKWISKRYAGGTPDKNNLKYWENGTIPWIASGEVNQEIVTMPTTYITEMGFKNSSTKWMPKDSLIVALAGQGKTKGMVAYLDIDTTGNQSLSAIIPKKKKINSKYLFYFIKAAYKELRGSAGDGHRDGLNLESLGVLIIIYPPKDEQLQIVAYIEEHTSKIDAAIELQQNYIAKLKEYKATLIDSIVTGKVRVA